MATVRCNQPQIFPPGTGIGLYPAAAQHTGTKPHGSALLETTTSAGGTGLVEITNVLVQENTPYVLFAEVGTGPGSYRYVAVRAESYVGEPATFARRKAAARTLVHG